MRRLKLSVCGYVNLILVLIITKIALLLIITTFSQMFTYKKIFDNEQSIYNDRINLEQELLQIANSNIERFVKIGFLPDDLSFLCGNGLNVYQFNINQKLYGYWGVRIFKPETINLIKQQQLYYKMLLSEKNLNVHKLTLIDSSGKNQVDQIFFLDLKNRLWKYDIAADRFLLQIANYNNINYIIGNDVFNRSQGGQFTETLQKYLIYIHTREKNQSTNDWKDMINIISPSHKNYNHNRTLAILESKNEIAKFMLCYNYLILLYKDLTLQPNIYKISNNNLNHNLQPRLLITAMDLKFQLQIGYVDDCQNKSNLPKFKLLWDAKNKQHKIDMIKQNCETITYTFNLPTDNNILSFRTNDY